MTQLLQRYLVDDRKYDRMLMTNDIEGAKPRRFIKDYKEAFHSYLDSINGRSKSEKKEIIIKNASNIINNNIHINANANSPPKIKQKVKDYGTPATERFYDKKEKSFHQSSNHSDIHSSHSKRAEVMRINDLPKIEPAKLEQTKYQTIFSPEKKSNSQTKRSISLHESHTNGVLKPENNGLSDYYLEKFEKGKKKKEQLMEFHFRKNIEDYKYPLDKNQLLLQKLYDPKIDVMSIRINKNTGPPQNQLNLYNESNMSKNNQNLYHYNIMSNKIVLMRNSEEKRKKYGDSIGTMHNNRFPGRLDIYQFPNSLSASPNKIFDYNK